MDKEIDKELERMVLENKYKKTLDFSEARCSKCINSLSGACSVHSKLKINMYKELMIQNIPESEKQKNIVDINSMTDGKIHFFVKKSIGAEYNKFQSIKKINKNNLVDINGKKCNDVSEMEFSFDDVFE
jgi:hypothetical protein